MLSQTRRFETKTTFEDNKILYVVTTRGELLPDNKPSKAITFDFQRLDKKKLIINEIFADEGPKLKRIRPRAQGRAYKILKPTCHITVVMTKND